MRSTNTMLPQGNPDEKTKLIDWYLARLRRMALNEEIRQQATPASLVGRDKAAIRSRIEASFPLLSEAAEVSNSGVKTDHWRWTVVLISLACGLLIALV